MSALLSVLRSILEALTGVTQLAPLVEALIRLLQPNAVIGIEHDPAPPLGSRIAFHDHPPQVWAAP